jgi:hypothetical protein
MPNVLMNGVLLGKELTRDRFLKLDLRKLYDDRRAFGARGASAIIFQCPDETLGIEEAGRAGPRLQGFCADAPSWAVPAGKGPTRVSAGQTKEHSACTCMRRGSDGVHIEDAIRRHGKQDNSKSSPNVAAPENLLKDVAPFGQVTMSKHRRRQGAAVTPRPAWIT